MLLFFFVCLVVFLLLVKCYIFFYWLFGLFMLVMCSGGEFICVVGEMYYIVMVVLMFWDVKYQVDFSKVSKVYKLVKLVFEYGLDSIYQWVNCLFGQMFVFGVLVRMCSVLNGVVGDKLVEWDYFLVMGMEMVDELGNDIQLSQLNF